jgi:hypothetical protein
VVVVDLCKYRGAVNAKPEVDIQGDHCQIPNSCFYLRIHSRTTYVSFAVTSTSLALSTLHLLARSQIMAIETSLVWMTVSRLMELAPSATTSARHIPEDINSIWTVTQNCQKHVFMRWPAAECVTESIGLDRVF